MEIFIRLFLVIVSAISIAILFQTPRKHLLSTIFIGAGTYYLNFYLKSNIHEIASIAISAFTMAIVSQILSKITKSPSQGFLIVGSIYLVPGLKILDLLKNAQTGNSVYALQNMYAAVAIVCAISFSILIATTIVPTYRDL